MPNITDQLLNFLLRLMLLHPLRWGEYQRIAPYLTREEKQYRTALGVERATSLLLRAKGAGRYQPVATPQDQGAFRAQAL
jgi:hypothetical protein